jgi:hypothetical protein
VLRFLTELAGLECESLFEFCVLSYLRPSLKVMTRIEKKKRKIEARKRGSKVELLFAF